MQLLILHCNEYCHQGHSVLTPRDRLTRTKVRRVCWSFEKCSPCAFANGQPGVQPTSRCESSAPRFSKFSAAWASPGPSVTAAAAASGFGRGPRPRGGPIGTADLGLTAPPLGPCQCLTQCLLTALAARAGHFPVCTLSDLFPAAPCVLQCGDLVPPPPPSAHVQGTDESP